MKISLTPYRVRLGLLGILIFFLTLVTELPARFAADWVRNHSTHQLNWQSLSGSLLDARIYGLEIGAGQGRVIHIDRLDMKTSVLALLSGRIVADVTAQLGQGQIHCKLVLGIWHWGIDDLNGEVDLLDLSGSIPELELMEASGDLVLAADNIEGGYDQLPMAGDVEIMLRQLGLTMVNSGRPLGDYKLTIDNINKEGIDGRIETVASNSQILITGEVLVNGSDRTFEVRAQAWAAADAGPEVKDLLPMLGPQDNGRVQIDWKRKL